MRILVLNSGSSSIKYHVFDMPSQRCLQKGIIEHIGEKGSGHKDHYSGIKQIISHVDDVDVAGHRVVHGGERFRNPVLINDSVIKKIKQYCELAPLHNPANLTGILACRKLLRGIKQVAVFDTAFYATLPEHAYIYGLPFSYYKKYSVRKYGFHGTSHHYVAEEAAKRFKRPLKSLRLITCHLGNGCSITAVHKGKAIETSMGFTPLEGLVMGTRCGDIDPALVTYLARKERMNLEAVDAMLNKASGLLGISGISNDMRSLEKEATKGNKRARLAIHVFCYRIQKYIGSYAAVMGGCDALIFTAGIGEHQAGIRKKITEGIFRHFTKKPKIMVIPTNEELMIAKQAYSLTRSR